MRPLHLVVLNYNGRGLLAECLPSVLGAAAKSRHACEVIVVDNDSSDESPAFLKRAFPSVRVERRPNRGLTSFNDVLGGLPGDVAVLLNNDIKLADDCIDPLVEPLLGTAADGEDREPACFMTAPLCWLFDGVTHEGLQAAVEWRWGLVRTLVDFPGNDALRHKPGLTAAAGPVAAVNRRLFLELGGFDSLYWPGRLEDLDFAFRGYQAGYVARYVPQAVAYHQGQASFDAAYGADGSLELALRNTLLFHWKNLRHPWHVARHLAAMPVRLAFDWLRAPWARPRRRFAFTRAFCAALARLAPCRSSVLRPCGSWRRERQFFRQFTPSQLACPAVRRSA